MGTSSFVFSRCSVCVNMGSTMHFLMLSALVAGVFGKVYFQEKFEDGDGWEDRWVQSKHAGKEFGKFKLSAGKFFADAEKSKGIQTPEDARFYGLSSKFDKFSNRDKDLVIQYSVKHEQNIDCGGGYLKLFGSDLEQTDMHGESPYKIMFGPDICGPGTKRVHVIFNYKGENKLIKEEIRCKDDEMSHLYTLIVKKDNTYEVRINNEKVKDGSLEEHWDFLEPKEIKDPEASKPSDWDDNPTIADPEDSKPEDWVETQHIPDPEAKKPEDWDDDMDGEWEPPMIDNPEYKGEWTAKQIDNPNYKGAWVHPMIANPKYVADDSLYAHDDISFVGLDLWQVKSGTIFDNFLITDDIEEATKAAEEFLEELKKPEQVAKDKIDEEERKKAEEEAKTSEADEDKDDEDPEDSDVEDLESESKEEEEPLEHDEL